MTITAATHAISIDPTSGERLTATPWASVEEIDHALNLAANGYSEWKHTSVEERAQMLRHIGQALRHRAEEMAQCIHVKWVNPLSRRVLKSLSQLRCVTGTPSMDRRCSVRNPRWWRTTRR